MGNSDADKSKKDATAYSERWLYTLGKKRSGGTEGPDSMH